MTDDTKPKGRYYHEVYLEPKEVVATFSVSTRLRMSKVFDVVFKDNEYSASEWIEGELGIEVPWRHNHRSPAELLQKAADPDVLRVITALAKFGGRLDYEAKRRGARAQLVENWVTRLNRILKEERVGFELDELGGVHPVIDQAFAAHKEGLVRGLGAKRFENVRAELEKGLRALDHQPSDWKGGVRGMFFAMEGMFQLTFGETDRLVEKRARTYLGAKTKSIIDPHERAAYDHLVASFAYWVNAAQQYRHEPGKEEQHQPPEYLAVLLFDQGLSFLRWLIELDAETQSA